MNTDAMNNTSRTDWARIDAMSDEDIDTSDSYRYPISTRGDYSTRLGQSVNLSSLSDHMDSLLENLDAINFGLNLETDIEQEVYEAYLNL